MADRPDTVQYVLQKLYVSEKSKGKYYGRCVPREVLGVQQLAERIVNRGSTLTVIDVVAVLTALNLVIEEELIYGNSINLSRLLNLRMTVKGVFETLNSPFENGLHGLFPSATFSSELRRAIVQKSKPERIPTESLNPVIDSYMDSANGTGNVFTPGAIATIRGRNLAFSPLSSTEGVYFIDMTDASNVRRVDAIAAVTKKAITFIVPEITNQSRPYRIEVRCLSWTEDNDLRVGSTSFKLYCGSMPVEGLSAKVEVKGLPNQKARIKRKAAEMGEESKAKLARKK